MINRYCALLIKGGCYFNYNQPLIVKDSLVLKMLGEGEYVSETMTYGNSLSFIAAAHSVPEPQKEVWGLLY